MPSLLFLLSFTAHHPLKVQTHSYPAAMMLYLRVPFRRSMTILSASRRPFSCLQSSIIRHLVRPMRVRSMVRVLSHFSPPSPRSLSPACSCDSVGSVGTDCEAYGGQCQCAAPEEGFSVVHGRQCSHCPFLTYPTPDGCAREPSLFPPPSLPPSLSPSPPPSPSPSPPLCFFLLLPLTTPLSSHSNCLSACNCPDPSEDCGGVSSGQCSCPTYVTGRTCDRCREGTFGDPSVGCTVSCRIRFSSYIGTV